MDRHRTVQAQAPCSYIEQIQRDAVQCNRRHLLPTPAATESEAATDDVEVPTDLDRPTDEPVAVNLPSVTAELSLRCNPARDRKWPSYLCSVLKD